MSKITNALRDIMSWMEEYQPRYANSFLPGLSKEEIEVNFQSLEVPINKEIYELYEWRNGRDVEPLINQSFFPSIYDLLPLGDVVDLYHYINLPPEDGGFLGEELEGRKLLPLFGRLDPGICACSINVLSPEEDAPLVFLFEAEIVPSYYVDLTTMIKTFYEFYSTGVYIVCEEVEIDGYQVLSLEEEPIKKASALRKYNSPLEKQALLNLSFLKRLPSSVSKGDRDKLLHSLNTLSEFRSAEALNVIETALETNENLYLYSNQLILSSTILTFGRLSGEQALRDLKGRLKNHGYHVQEIIEDAILDCYMP